VDEVGEEQLSRAIERLENPEYRYQLAQGAVAASAAGDRSAARELSRSVLDHWSGSNPRLQIVQLAAKLNRL